MKISVRVRPNARRTGVEQQEDGSYRVSVTASPVEGKANEQLIEVLADFFDKPKRAITIVRGGQSKNKVVEIV